MAMVNVQLENVVVNMDGVVKQTIIVYHLKVVNLNLVNAQREKHLLLPRLLKLLLPPPRLLLKLQPPLQLQVNVVRNMENVHLDNVVVNMDGVVNRMSIVPPQKVVNPNLENVLMKMKVNVVKDMENVHLDYAVVNMDGVVQPQAIVNPVVKVNMENVNKISKNSK